MARHGLAGFLRQGVALTAEAPQHAETQTRYIHMAAATAPLQKSAGHHFALGSTRPRRCQHIRLELLHADVIPISGGRFEWASSLSSHFGLCKSDHPRCHLGLSGSATPEEGTKRASCQSEGSHKGCSGYQAREPSLKLKGQAMRRRHTGKRQSKCRKGRSEELASCEATRPHAHKTRPAGLSGL